MALKAEADKVAMSKKLSEAQRSALHAQMQEREALKREVSFDECDAQTSHSSLRRALPFGSILLWWRENHSPQAFKSLFAAIGAALARFLNSSQGHAYDSRGLQPQCSRGRESEFGSGVETDGTRACCRGVCDRIAGEFWFIDDRSSRSRRRRKALLMDILW